MPGLKFRDRNGTPRFGAGVHSCRFDLHQKPMAFSIFQLFFALPSKLREKDKRLHMAWSFWLTLFALLLWPTPWAFSAVFMIGLAKECWDSRYGSGFCVFDLLANITGSSFALVFAWALPGTLFNS